MKIVFAKESFDATKSDLLVIPFTKDGENKLFTRIDKKSRGALRAQVRQEKFRGEESRQLEWCGKISGIHVRRIVLAGVGNKVWDSTRWRNAIGRALNVALRRKLKSVSVYVDDCHPAAVGVCAEALLLGSYRFEQHKTQKSSSLPPTKGRVGVYDAPQGQTVLSGALKDAIIGAGAVVRCRDLVNQPANHLGPQEFAQIAKNLAAETGIGIKVLTQGVLKKQGMNLLNAVGGASDRAPCLVHLSYAPKGDVPRIALVGKGITFDSGGLCLKPGPSMYRMKTDMAGAAVVLSTICAAAALKVEARIDAIIPLADNSIGKAATKPGDVIQSLSGLTVEILNTDAEGRLVLADALAYADTLKPAKVIDFATLTGACSVALGQKRAALFSNDEQMGIELMSAAHDAGELLWPLPLAAELERETSSEVADVKNIGGRFGGSIVAALFLQRFVHCPSWAHLDIAGPARNDKSTNLCVKGGTGFGVLTCLEFLKSI